jgi:hypothetical protein
MPLFLVEEYLVAHPVNRITYAWEAKTLEDAADIARNFVHEDGVRAARIVEYNSNAQMTVREVPREEWPE